MSSPCIVEKEVYDFVMCGSGHAFTGNFNVLYYHLLSSFVSVPVCCLLTFFSIFYFEKTHVFVKQICTYTCVCRQADKKRKVMIRTLSSRKKIFKTLYWRRALKVEVPCVSTLSSSQSLTVVR